MKVPALIAPLLVFLAQPFSAAAFECSPPTAVEQPAREFSNADFDVRIRRFETGFNPESGYCYTQARMAFAPDGRGIFTCSALYLGGMDVYSGLFYAQTSDFGKTWTPFKASKTVRRVPSGDTEKMFLDPSPFYHSASGKFVILGAMLSYRGNKHLGDHRAAYAVFDESSGDFSAPRALPVPFAISGAGCVQVLEKEGGRVLVPISFSSGRKANSSVCVLECSFDGAEFGVEKIGGAISHSVPRGVCEPSIIEASGWYYLSLRNDETSYIARSRDGLNYEPKVPLKFDDGALVGSYNTQTHWLSSGGSAYLVYTRRGANNDHVFRHRAPLFAARLDPEKLALARSTETAVVPERGARLGNFGCVRVSDSKWVVVAAEWMQGAGGWRGCMARGSNNSIFASEILLKK